MDSKLSLAIREIPFTLWVMTLNRVILVTAISLFLSACGEGENSENGSGDTNQTSGNPITAPVDYLGAVANAKKSTEGKLAIAQLEQAVNYYKIENGSFPKSLDDLLSSDHLSRMPKVPYKTKLSYDPNTGKVDIIAAE